MIEITVSEIISTVLIISVELVATIIISVLIMVLLDIKGKNIDNRYMKKWRSLAKEYEDALLYIRGIAVSALYSEDNTNCLNSLENIHQKAAQTLWEQKND